MKASVLRILLIASSLIFLYTSGFGSFSTLTQRALHWTLMTVAVFLSFRAKRPTTSFACWAAALAAAASGIYVIVVWPMRIFRLSGAALPDLLMGALAILILLLALKLTVGWGLTITASFFLFYALFGPIFPGFFGHSGVQLPRLINFLYMTAEGVFGIALGISSTYIIAFVIFGAFLQAFGGGQWFVDVSYAVAGRFRGGPAKTAIFASALMGMISGAPVANVATTGTFTIPLMKKVGYQASTAGAIEAVASTGGMFLPPVMGAGAFIMAEYLNISYLAVCAAAIIPAVLYYVALFLIADIRAAKNNIRGMDASDLPSIRETLFKKGYHAIPLIYLISAIVLGRSPLLAAFWATVFSAVIGIAIEAVFEKKNTWHRKVLTALYDGSFQIMPIAMACSGAGIIVGVLGVTGLGTKIASGLLALSGGVPILGLLFTMIAAIILGTGMPVTAVYIILAATLARPLADMGILPLAAHLFIFMFSAVAGLTPPVAITSYTAAGIANANANEVAIKGFLFGLPGFIIPYIFVFAPALLLQGPLETVLLAVATGLFGILCLTVAIEGYFIVRWQPPLRVMLFAAALFAMVPGLLSDIVSVVIVLTALGIRILLHRTAAEAKV